MDELDAAIALVYAEPPTGFVSARAALVKELKAAKRKEDAAKVATLRRPTKLAWTLGQAVRRAPQAAEAYFDAIAGLEPAGGMTRSGADLRQRAADLRRAVAALVEAAEPAEPGEATAALLATAADPEAAAALRLGRLAEVPVAGGFGGVAFGGVDLTVGEAPTSVLPASARTRPRAGTAVASGRPTQARTPMPESRSRSAGSGRHGPWPSGDEPWRPSGTRRRRTRPPPPTGCGRRGRRSRRRRPSWTGRRLRSRPLGRRCRQLRTASAGSSDLRQTGLSPDRGTPRRRTWG